MILILKYLIPLFSLFYGVYISNVSEFTNRNQFLTAKLLKQGNQYHRLRKIFSKFYHRHSKLVVKYNDASSLF